MLARFHDGLTSAAHSVDVRPEGNALVFEAAGERHCWPLAEIDVESLGDSIRVTQGHGHMARLLIETAAWRGALGDAALPLARNQRRRHWILVAGLTTVAAAVAMLVFVGLPLAAGPLARHTPPQFERGLGRSFESQLHLAFRSCKGREGQAALAAFGHRLQAGTGAPFALRVEAVEAPMTNAFALPGGAIFITDDLIELAQTPDELAAVIAHEAAHVEKRHVMQSVWRSLGVGLILDLVVGGGSGAGQQAVLLAGSFADLRYSRAAETEADRHGQALLHAHGLSSQGMAPFFERLAAKGESPQAAQVQELISTHPGSLRRARESRANARPGAQAFTPTEWAAISQACQAPDRPLRLPLPGKTPNRS